MLWNPKHEQNFDWTKPSLEGFAAFVAFKLLRDPHDVYDWSSVLDCPVAEYLKQIGAFSNRHNELYPELNDLACGGKWRDARGRFTTDPDKVGTQWSYRALWQRIKDELGPSRLRYSVTCEVDRLQLHHVINASSQALQASLAAPESARDTAALPA